jgi:AAA family ATP:ADP antiporter
MYSFLLRKLNVERNEAGFIILLFISACSLGTFLSTFDVAAHSVFLDKMPQKDLALVYLFSGILGLIIFNIYSLSFRRISVKLFNLIILSVFLIVTTGYFLFNLIQPNKWTAFLSLTLMFPINLLALLNFWRYVRKLLQPVQLRKVSGFLELGVVIGIIVGGYGIIGILLFYSYYLIPIVTLLAIIVHFVLQFPLNVLHNKVDTLNHKKDHFVPIGRSSLFMFSSKYTSYLFFFAFLSAVIGFLIHFVFINLTRASFPHILGMSKFYGLFTGTLYLFMFGVDKFLARKILYSYDSPYSLVLLPIASAAILFITLVILLTLGNSTALSRFTFLFILMGMSKIVYETTKYTIQIPSQRTLFKTLDIRFLQTIFPRTEGSIVMLGMIASGGIIIGLISANFYSLIIILILALVLTGAWFFFSVKLIKTYKSSLIESYKKMRISRTLDNNSDNYNERIRKILVGTDTVRVINTLKLSSQIEPLTYEKSLQRMLANPEPAIQEYVLQCIQDEKLLDFLPDLKKMTPASEKVKEFLDQICDEFEKNIIIHDTKKDIEHLVNSRSVHDRVFAAEVIGVRKDIKLTPALVNLSREFEPEVKLAAVKAMVRIRSSEHSYLLIELLNSPQFHAYAFEALIEIGEPAIEYLERLFMNPGTDDNILARAVRIYGRIGTTRSLELLLNKLENQSKRVTLHTIEALREANFQANNLNIHRILNFIVRIISSIGWNFLVYTSLPKNEKFKKLRHAFKEENDTNYFLLFELLALAYNPRTIYQIRDLIENGSQSDISHAIELLDHFIFEDIKAVLFPILENISEAEKVKRLQYYFPIESMTNEEIISATLTRDYNLLSIYPRICSMQLSFFMPEIQVSNELISNLFHPNALLREIAATVIYKKDPGLFADVLLRLEPEIKRELNHVIGTIENPEELQLINKFELLRKTNRISHLDEEILIEMARYLVVHRIAAGNNIELKNHSDEFSLFIVVSGKMLVKGIEIDAFLNNKYELFYSKILVNFGAYSMHFPEETIVMSINNEAVENLLFDYTEMANCVLSCVENFKMAV